MRFDLCLLASVFVSVFLFSSQATADNNLGTRTLQNVKIPMRDGKYLAADIVIPEGDGPFPTIYVHTPYKRQNIADPIPDSPYSKILLDRKNYAYVGTDWRGKFGSKDAGSNLSNDYLGQDGYDVIEWIAKQPWSNGRIGMWGLSAPGYAEYAIAAAKPPHLLCIIPASASPNSSYGQFYYGGVFEELYGKLLPQIGYGAGRFLRFHDTYDNFWKRIESKVSTKDIDLPTLMMTGWYDIRPQTKLDVFNELRSSDKKFREEMKLLVGPWTHVKFGISEQGELSFPEAVDDFSNEVMSFFDYHLRGIHENGWRKRAVVRYFQMGTNDWHALDSWPAPTQELFFYLNGNHSLTANKPFSPDDSNSTKNSESFTFDPNNPSPTIGGGLLEFSKLKGSITAGPLDQREVEKRSDALIFTTEVLSNDLPIIGSAKVELFVSSNRKDTDFSARLTDVYPDGRSILVADGIWRMRFRNSLEKEDLLEPGKIYSVTIPLSTTGQTFLKGHRLRLIISSSNYPRFAVNSNSTARFRLFRRNLLAQNTVFFSEEYPSRLVLPRLTR